MSEQADKNLLKLGKIKNTEIKKKNPNPTSLTPPPIPRKTKRF